MGHYMLGSLTDIKLFKENMEVRWFRGPLDSSRNNQASRESGEERLDVSSLIVGWSRTLQ